MVMETRGLLARALSFGAFGGRGEIGRLGAQSGERMDRAEECLKRYLAHGMKLAESEIVLTSGAMPW